MFSFKSQDFLKRLSKGLNSIKFEFSLEYKEKLLSNRKYFLFAKERNHLLKSKFTYTFRIS